MAVEEVVEIWPAAELFVEDAEALLLNRGYIYCHRNFPSQTILWSSPQVVSLIGPLFFEEYLESAEVPQTRNQLYAGHVDLTL